MLRILILLISAMLVLPLHAQPRAKTYAQELVDQLVARQPELLVVALHVTPPGAGQNVIIASNIGRLGKPGDEDDLRVIQSGQPRLKASADGRRYSVDLVLQDVVGATVGSLSLVWPLGAGQDAQALAARSTALRDQLARRILNGASLMDPYPYEAGATLKTYAQKLVDQAVARDPHVAVLALRGPASPGGELVLLGSTFGRHGKKADADDLKILQSTQPATGVYSGGKRFGVDLQLHDRSGATVGTMNVGYLLGAGDDTQALLAQALRLRDELQQRIPSADALGALDP
jgi:hypothetical protein